MNKKTYWRLKMKRASGVLMHVSSLPSNYGIGTFGKSAYEFVDFLVETRQTFWQILPLTTTAFGDSPYKSYSAFAGNTNFIDFDLLIEEGYLEEEEVKKKNFGDNIEKVNYNQINVERRIVFEKAVQKYIERNGTKNDSLQEFVEQNKKWLIPYAQFMTFKEYFNREKSYKWPEEYREYNKERMKELSKEHYDQINYHIITQYWFFEQWIKLKKYANDHYIQIFGDLPIYVSRDSVEMWTSPELSLLEEDGTPRVVSGSPPDYFSAEGQYWGTPIYDWNAMEENGYSWWVERLKGSFDWYDFVRLDHFRGFESFWEIPFGADSAKDGRWVSGPGKKLFESIKKELGDLKIVAEDLGHITKEVNELLKFTQFPGMTLLQDAFDGKEESESMPHNHQQDSFLYIGTHDSPTGYGWYTENINEQQRKQVDEYLKRCPNEPVSDLLIRGIAASPSRVAIYTMQDLLQLDNSARMNVPGTVGDNWNWRMKPKAMNEALKEKLLNYTKTYYRENKEIISSYIP